MLGGRQSLDVDRPKYIVQIKLLQRQLFDPWHSKVNRPVTAPCRKMRRQKRMYAVGHQCRSGTLPHAYRALSMWDEDNAYVEIAGAAPAVVLGCGFASQWITRV
jgi:hypothetical protein